MSLTYSILKDHEETEIFHWHFRVMKQSQPRENYLILELNSWK